MKIVYSGKPKVVGYAVIAIFFTLSIFFWLWTHTDKPLSPYDLYKLETEDANYQRSK